MSYSGSMWVPSPENGNVLVSPLAQVDEVDSDSECSVASWRTEFFWDDSHIMQLMTPSDHSPMLPATALYDTEWRSQSIRDARPWGSNSEHGQSPTASSRVGDVPRCPPRSPQAAEVAQMPTSAASSSMVPFIARPRWPPLRAEQAGHDCTAGGASVMGPPMALILCEHGGGFLEGLANNLGLPETVQVQQFETADKLIRWLFSQPRGKHVVPWATLVVGWREAKPCAMALGAARSGDVSHLRPDARRPLLQPLAGEVADEVNLAVRQVIINLSAMPKHTKTKHRARARAWFEKEGQHLLGKIDCKIVIAEDGLRALIARSFACNPS
mmetsp:Transcript_112698/g.291185  ORF Transcript_112698/g.291185 Transcript_112698/m.291185 type:complete len:327 (-) Transcript_112698:89-1069(-)